MFVLVAVLFVGLLTQIDLYFLDIVFEFCIILFTDFLHDPLLHHAPLEGHIEVLVASVFAGKHGGGATTHARDSYIFELSIGKVEGHGLQGYC